MQLMADSIRFALAREFLKLNPAGSIPSPRAIMTPALDRKLPSHRAGAAVTTPGRL